MKLRFTVASLVVALAVLGAVMAEEMPGQADANDRFIPAPPGGSGDKPMGDTIVRVAAVTQQVAQFASLVAIIGPPTAQQSALRPTSPVKPAAAAHPLLTRIAAKSRGKTVSELARSKRLASGPKPMLVRCVGRPQTGKAAWYGGHYIGQRTSSGDRLDTIRPTAAHRTLPLNSLARVTNLENGRSVIVKVNDRGPVSSSLLIDMSPRAAEQLAMKEAGVVPVKVEQVVEVSPDAK